MVYPCLQTNLYIAQTTFFGCYFGVNSRGRCGFWNRTCYILESKTGVVWKWGPLPIILIGNMVTNQYSWGKETGIHHDSPNYKHGWGQPKVDQIKHGIFWSAQWGFNDLWGKAMKIQGILRRFSVDILPFPQGKFPRATSPSQPARSSTMNCDPHRCRQLVIFHPGDLGKVKLCFTKRFYPWTGNRSQAYWFLELRWNP